jgi:hypothetical protein
MAMSDHQARWRPQPAEFGGPDASGRRTLRGTTGMFELLCATCGDDEGPIEQVSEELRELRGPYRNVERVREALLIHRFSEEP